VGSYHSSNGVDGIALGILKERGAAMSKDQKNILKSRFEFEEDGAVAYLEFETDSTGWITLWHTEVPEPLRGRGLSSLLAKTALEYARENSLKVDVICPLVKDYIHKNPEYASLVGR
jgi:predicted GNAT family acetyltransferase